MLRSLILRLVLPCCVELRIGLRESRSTGKSKRGKQPQYGAALNNLGTQLLFANRYADAELLFRQALAIGEKNNSPEDPRPARISTGSRPGAWIAQRPDGCSLRVPSVSVMLSPTALAD